jgi:putative CocE/NonD family hydrolase
MFTFECDRWYDIFQNYGVQAFNDYQELSAPTVRGEHYLFVGPKGHCFGAGNFPGALSILPINVAREVFLGIPANEGFWQRQTDKLTLYVMGPSILRYQDRNTVGNYYTSLPAWPTITTPTKLYFYADGTMDGRPPAANDTALQYAYDPRDPVSTQGGANLFGPCGPQEVQTYLGRRSDVLSFESAALENHLAAVGHVTATLYVSSDALDTDFTVMLADKYPSGESVLITDGAVRMRWRASKTEPTHMEPGVVYEVVVDVWWTAFVFNAQHRIQVFVSSSNSPRYEVCVR